MAIHQKCEVCGTLLEEKICIACMGTGIISRSFLSQKICEDCKGRGRLVLCPNWLSHSQVPRELKVRRPSVPKSAHDRSSQPARRCSMCGGTGGVRHPFTGQIGPCPRCKGKGTL